MLYNFVPPYSSATVIERLQGQGAVLAGRLNLDEFAMGSSCENSHFQKTANPHDLTRVPGGSSAAVLAAGEAILALPVALSVCLPPYCGIVGLKPAYGAVSRYGLVAFASSFDQIGPMVRTVEDMGLLFSAICGADSRRCRNIRPFLSLRMCAACASAFRRSIMAMG